MDDTPISPSPLERTPQRNGVTLLQPVAPHISPEPRFPAPQSPRQVLQYVRRFLDDRNFVEVRTRRMALLTECPPSPPLLPLSRLMRSFMHTHNCMTCTRWRRQC